MSEQMLDIAKIRIDGDTQPRMAIDQGVVAEYADLLKGGTELPPVQVVSDGAVHWLVDGFHRYFAHRKLMRKQIKAEVITGLQEEAQWLSLSANKAHGLRRTNNDKAKAVSKALKMKPELSDNAIAGHVGVANVTVAKYRQSIEEARKQRENKDVTAAASGIRNLHLPARVGRDGKKYPARPSKPSIPPHAVHRRALVNLPRQVFAVFDARQTPAQTHRDLQVQQHIGIAAGRRKQILTLLRAGERLRVPGFAEKMGCSFTTAKREVDALKAEGQIEFVGPAKTGYYKIAAKLGRSRAES